jgi:hypothetical protein
MRTLQLYRWDDNSESEKITERELVAIEGHVRSVMESGTAGIAPDQRTALAVLHLRLNLLRVELLRQTTNPERPN